MPFNGQGAASGAASGAAAGTAIMPGWGTAIGAVAGGVMGGLSGGDSKPPTPPQLEGYPTIGAVQGTYGGSYVDPVTGRVVYSSNTTAPNLQSYQDQNTYNQIMGYGGGGTDLANQIASQQKTLDALKAQGPGGVKITDFVDPNWVGADGKILDYQNFINKRGTDNPLWQEFMSATGGNYGSSNPDISFGKWAKDAYQRNITPQKATFEKAQKTSAGNQPVFDQQVRDAESQLKSLQDIQTQVYGTGGTGSGDSQNNPMLSYLQHGPNQADLISRQVTDQYNNAMTASDAANAHRGMGASSMSELAHAQGANQLAQGILGAQVTGGQNNFNNSMAMMNMLTGNKAQAQGNQNATTGLYNQQMGMGQGVATNAANMTAQQNAAQAGMNLQSGMAQYNASQTQSMANQNALNSGAQAIGNAYGTYNSNQAMKDWLANQNNLNRTSTYGSDMNGQMGGSSYTPYPTTGLPANSTGSYLDYIKY